MGDFSTYMFLTMAWITFGVGGMPSANAATRIQASGVYELLGVTTAPWKADRLEIILYPSTRSQTLVTFAKPKRWKNSRLLYPAKHSFVLVRARHRGGMVEIDHAELALMGCPIRVLNEIEYRNKVRHEGAVKYIGNQVRATCEGI